ncbi:MAG TPA: transposase [Candidatus Hydrogenedentes bacterium]|nr:transposase [Candidatus Hydrogenedentota bacterium]
MPQSFVRILGHLIFSTKHRIACLNPEIRPKLYGYMAGVLQDEGCREILIGGADDHVHIAFAMAKMSAPIKLVEVVKKQSSKWIKTQDPAFDKFYWQSGYALFSVSPSNLDTLRGYILKQEQHHKKVTFQDELRILLRKHGVEFDERYMWD